MNKLKLVKSKLAVAYFGTPYVSARFLEKLITDTLINQLIEVKLVVTQPDKPVGRRQILTPTPVKLVARKYGIFIYDNFQFPISNFSDVSVEVRSKASDQTNFNFQKTNFQFQNIDLALLFAFGQIIPKKLLNLPRYGFLNIHPSLLPKYRGASPLAYPLILGDKKTGVTIIKMDEKMDHGPIVAQEEMPILPADRRPDLEIKLTDLAFEMFKKLISKMYGQPSGLSLQIKPQNHKLATYTRLLKKSDGFIPLTTLKKALNNEPLTSEELPKIIKDYYQKNNLAMKQFNNLAIYDLFRGLYPWPGLWTILPNGKRLKITNLTIKQFNNLTIESVQLEGKKEVEFKQFNKAYKIF
jgi:methionyl-tRNA formyltransferase